MSTVIRSLTTTEKTHVLYEVFVNGICRWKCTVYFRNDRRNRAGGPAFVEAARSQEKEAQRLTGLHS